jgi:hypothetical protein
VNPRATNVLRIRKRLKLCVRRIPEFAHYKRIVASFGYLPCRVCPTGAHRARRSAQNECTALDRHLRASIGG